MIQDQTTSSRFVNSLLSLFLLSSDEMYWQKAWSTKFPSAPTHSYPTLASWVIKRLNNRITGRWTDIATGRFDLEWKVCTIVIYNCSLWSIVSSSAEFKILSWWEVVQIDWLDYVILLRSTPCWTIYPQTLSLSGNSRILVPPATPKVLSQRCPSSTAQRSLGSLPKSDRDPARDYCQTKLRQEGI